MAIPLGIQRAEAVERRARLRIEKVQARGTAEPEAARVRGRAIDMREGVSCAVGQLRLATGPYRRTHVANSGGSLIQQEPRAEAAEPADIAGIADSAIAGKLRIPRAPSLRLAVPDERILHVCRHENATVGHGEPVRARHVQPVVRAETLQRAGGWIERRHAVLAEREPEPAFVRQHADWHELPDGCHAIKTPARGIEGEEPRRLRTRRLQRACERAIGSFDFRLLKPFADQPYTPCEPREITHAEQSRLLRSVEFLDRRFQLGWQRGKRRHSKKAGRRLVGTTRGEAARKVCWTWRRLGLRRRARHRRCRRRQLHGVQQFFRLTVFAQLLEGRNDRPAPAAFRQPILQLRSKLRPHFLEKSDPLPWVAQIEGVGAPIVEGGDQAVRGIHVFAPGDGHGAPPYLDSDLVRPLRRLGLGHAAGIAKFLAIAISIRGVLQRFERGMEKFVRDGPANRP